MMPSERHGTNLDAILDGELTRVFLLSSSVEHRDLLHVALLGILLVVDGVVHIAHNIRIKHICFFHLEKKREKKGRKRIL